MKKCPNGHNQDNDNVKFCPECGCKISVDLAVQAPSNISVQKPLDLALQGCVGLESSKNIEMNSDDAALAFVYIAQYARPDGPDCAGVLVECAGEHVDDCKQHFDGIANLLDQGAVEEKIWAKYRCRGFITTPEGSRRASVIIQQRLDQAKDALKSRLDSLPPRLVLFFRQEVLGAAGDNGRCLKPDDSGYLDETPPNPGSHLCLLNDPKIKKLCDEVMTSLIYHGLAETPQSYVATEGGKTCGKVYTISPEVSAFFDKYLLLAGQSTATPLFNEVLEAKHQIFHILSDKKFWNRETLHQMNEIQGSNRAGLKRVLIKLAHIKALGADPGRLFVVDSNNFKKVVHQEFFSPLVEYLIQPLDFDIIAVHPAPAIEPGIKGLQIGSKAFGSLISKIGEDED